MDFALTPAEGMADLEERLVEARQPRATADRLLDDVRAWLATYVSTMHEDDLDLLALWTVHTHLVVETYTTPRLLIDSPVPGSGKTTTMEHLQRLCLRPVLMSTVSSSAMLARILDPTPRTLLIDEADRSLRPDKETTPDVIAILNSGYKRGATRPVSVPVKGGGWEIAEMPTFAPVAMAGNSPNLPDDTRSRTIRVLLMPDLDGTVEESDWEMIEDDAAKLAGRISQWADRHREQVRIGTRPAMPPGVTGRFREKWQPLARVAAAAGGRWPGAVAAMAAADVEQVQADREDGMVTDRPHVVLLQHLAAVWPPGEAFTSSAELVDLLIAHDRKVWSVDSSYGRDLTVQRLGRMLASHYKVNSRQRPIEPRRRGYAFADLLPAWRRMAITPPDTTPDRTVQTVPTVQTVRIDPKPNGSHGSNTPNGSSPTPTCPVCGGPNSSTRDDAGLDCLDCYARGAA